MFKTYIKLLIIAFILLLSFFTFKDRVFDDKTIIIGSSLPYSGSIDPWGDAVNSGVHSYFNYANEFGLIKDKKIDFIAYNDKYEPELTYENIKKLVTQNSVFAFFAFVGTPTIKRVLPLLYDEDIPFFSPFSGASFLRQTTNENFINFRASYEEEIEHLIKYVVDNKKLNKIAVFYQNDDYGEEGYIATIQSLEKRDLKVVAQGSYKRNTLSISHAFNELKNANPEVIFMIGAYKANSLFIKKAKEDKTLQNTIFCNISFGDANSMIKDLHSSNTATNNILFSQVVPSYTDTSIEVVNEYQKIMKKYFPEKDFGFLSFEAFLASKVLVDAIARIDNGITREKFLKNLKTTPKDLLKGIDLEYKNSQLLNKTFLFKYENNEFIKVEE